MNVSHRQLKIFVALSHALSFSRCADQLNLAQPTLSKLVREIEEAVGVRLFERTTRRVRLTPEGASLLPIASRMIDNYEAGLSELRGVTNGHSLVLSIAAMPSLSALLLPQSILAMQSEFPEAVTSVYDVMAEEALDLLRRRRVNMALTAIMPGLENDRDLETIELMSDDFVLLCSRARPPKLKEKVWSEDVLSELHLITMPRGSSTRLALDVSIPGDSSVRPVFELRNMTTIKKFVQIGLGVAVLPELAALMLADDENDIVHLSGAPKRSIGTVTRRGETPAKPTRRIISAMKTFSDAFMRSREVSP